MIRKPLFLVVLGSCIAVGCHREPDELAFLDRFRHTSSVSPQEGGTIRYEIFGAPEAMLAAIPNAAHGRLRAARWGADLSFTLPSGRRALFTYPTRPSGPCHLLVCPVTPSQT